MSGNRETYCGCDRTVPQHIQGRHKWCVYVLAKDVTAPLCGKCGETVHGCYCGVNAAPPPPEKKPCEPVAGVTLHDNSCPHQPPPEEKPRCRWPDCDGYESATVHHIWPNGHSFVPPAPAAAGERVTLHRHPEWTGDYWETCLDQCVHGDDMDENDRYYSEYEHAEYVPARLLEDMERARDANLQKARDWEQRALKAEAQERERCARMVDEFHDGCTEPCGCLVIAVKIREGKP